MPFVEIKVLSWQGDFLNCEDSHACVIGGFASGKSFICANWFIDRCLQYPEARHVVVAKDLPQLKIGPCATLRGELDSRGVEYSYNQSTGAITMENGCVILPKSAQNFKSFRALEADTIWADELADWGPSGEEAFVRYIAPRLRYSPEGKQYIADGMKPQLRISSNPSALGSWLHRLIVGYEDRGPYCRSWNVSMRDNILMPNLEQYVKQQENTLSKDLWPFLIDGMWGSTTTGTVYKGFNRVLETRDPSRLGFSKMGLDVGKPLLWSLDFNVGLMCSVVLQSHPQQRIVDNSRKRSIAPVQFLDKAVKFAVDGFQHNIMYVIDELRIPNAGTPDVVREFLSRYGEHAKKNGVFLYGDASGGGKAQQLSAQSAARSNWAIILQGLQQAGIKVTFRVQNANPAVLDRVNQVKAQIETGQGRGLFIDSLRCPHTCNDLESVKWKEGTNDIDKDDDKMTHLSDALGYVLWVERELAMKNPIHFKTQLD